MEHWNKIICKQMAKTAEYNHIKTTEATIKIIEAMLNFSSRIEFDESVDDIIFPKYTFFDKIKTFIRIIKCNLYGKKLMTKRILKRRKRMMQGIRMHASPIVIPSPKAITSHKEE